MEKYAIASQTSQGCSGFSQEQRGTQELNTWWQGGVRMGCEADAGRGVKPGHPNSPNRLQKIPFLGVASLVFNLFTFLQGDCMTAFPGDFLACGTSRRDVGCVCWS